MRKRHSRLGFGLASINMCRVVCPDEQDAIVRPGEASSRSGLTLASLTSSTRPGQLTESVLKQSCQVMHPASTHSSHVPFAALIPHRGAHISHPDSALFTIMGITRYPRQHHDLQQPREDIRQSPYPWYLGYDDGDSRGFGRKSITHVAVSRSPKPIAWNGRRGRIGKGLSRSEKFSKLRRRRCEMWAMATSSTFLIRPSAAHPRSSHAFQPSQHSLRHGPRHGCLLEGFNQPLHLA